jgi:predicted kinase
MIVLMAGLPGTGKSTLALALAARTFGVVFDKDQIRSALFSSADIEYSSQQDDLCIDVALQAAAYLLRKHPSHFVFLDGRPFSKTVQIEQVLQAAKQMKQPWRILECVCLEETARQRIAAQAGEHPAENRDYDLYLRLKRSWQEITLPKAEINTEQPFEQCVEFALATIRT